MVVTWAVSACLRIRNKGLLNPRFQGRTQRLALTRRLLYIIYSLLIYPIFIWATIIFRKQYQFRLFCVVVVYSWLYAANEYWSKANEFGEIVPDCLLGIWSIESIPIYSVFPTATNVNWWRTFTFGDSKNVLLTDIFHSLQERWYWDRKEIWVCWLANSEWHGDAWEEMVQIERRVPKVVTEWYKLSIISWRLSSPRAPRQTWNEHSILATS